MTTPPLVAPAPPGFEPVSARVLTDIDVLPCDVFIWRGPKPVMYATRGTDLRTLVDRSYSGIALLVRESDSDLLREALAASLPHVLADERYAPLERAQTVYSIAAKVLVPVFDRARAVDHDGVLLCHAVMDSITDHAIRDEQMMWALVGAAPKRLAAHTHGINTAVYAMVLARSCGIEDAEGIRDIARGGLLHDIGKNRVPREIVDKPGPLDAEEWTVMRGHVKAGHEMVVKSLGYVPSYAHIITEHHERCDGSGYPSGRGAAAIAMDSQLVGIADAFDALTCKRSYRDAVTAFEALRLMRVAMHGQFSDNVLRNFIRVLGSWQQSGGFTAPAAARQAVV
jgi:putative nucleotidyltransferase with HDIG domain